MRAPHLDQPLQSMEYIVYQDLFLESVLDLMILKLSLHKKYVNYSINNNN